MEIIFLGTSAGTPTKTRNVSGTVLKMASAKPWYLVDCGEGTQHQILHTNLSLLHLQAIFITHIHGDHCYGLPGLLASAAMLGRTTPLTIVAPASINKLITCIQTYSQLTLPYELNFFAIENINEKVELNDFYVDVIELSHGVPSFAFCFVEKNIDPKLDAHKLEKEGITQGPIWGTLQQGRDVTLPNGKTLISDNYFLEKRSPRKVIISGDNDNPSLLTDCSLQADVVIHEATYTDAVAEKVGKEFKHCTAGRIAKFAADSAVKNLILTHFSPRYQIDAKDGCSITDIETEAKSFYKGNLFLANDFDTYYLGIDGKVNKSRD